MTLDKQIDYAYWGETFYVLKKVPFEQIVRLQEEYHAKAIMHNDHTPSLVDDRWKDEVYKELICAVPFDDVR